ncbi:MFS transporter permease [Psychrobacillus sp. FSL K6-4615]|uniref:MFS transporter permease n=1 Tax=Psychrobacillus TaxID=1221880 RepID=UPI0030F737DE
MKKKMIILYIALATLLIMIGKSFILNESVKYYLVIFMFVGLGLALLRIGVNTAIKKIKGKHISLKILFFAVLLGLGLPFQNWFRKSVIFAMDSDYILPCIITTAASVFFFTIIFGLLFPKDHKNHTKKLEQ